jgi:hypothetical protein
MRAAGLGNMDPLLRGRWAAARKPDQKKSQSRRKHLCHGKPSVPRLRAS